MLGWTLAGQALSGQSVSIVTIPLSLGAISNTSPRAGEQFTVVIADGEGAITSSVALANLTKISQTSTLLTLVAPHPMTHGNKSLDFLDPTVITVSDGTTSHDVSIQIQPEVGYLYGTTGVADDLGFYQDDDGADDGVANLAAGLSVYWQTLSGDVVPNLETGLWNLTVASSGRYAISDGEWSVFVTEIFPAPPLPDPSQAPVLSFGSTSTNQEEGNSYSDPIWTATDDVGSVPVVWSGDVVNINVPAVYIRTATATNIIGYDSQDYTVIITQAVIIVPPTPTPTENLMISLNGANPLNILQGQLYVDPSATALDAIDGDISSDILVTGDIVNTAVVGAYEISYSVTNSSNETSVVTRVVNVFTPVAYTPFYQWYRDGLPIAGANASTYIPIAADIGANLHQEKTMITTTVI